ncbi:BT1926 family outer membrane beta-barrel protein, partial [Bacteroides hominis]
GVSFTNNPGYPAVPGTIDGSESNGSGSADDLMGEIPNYRAVASAQSFAYNVSAGVDRYFNIKRVPNLMWYTGVRVGFAYGE